MSDAFRDLTPQEIQNTLLQFMGENIGELKQLDQSLLNKNNTLQGMTLKPAEVLRTVAVDLPKPVLVVSQPLEQTAPLVQTQSLQATITPTDLKSQVMEGNPEDPNQLIFDFVNDIGKTPSIVHEIQSTAKRISVIEFTLKKIEAQLESIEAAFKQAQIKKKVTHIA